MKYILNLINILYLILIFLFIISICLFHSLTLAISLVVLLGFIFIRNKININKKYLIIFLFLLLIIIDIFLLKINYNDPIGDYNFFYQSAVSFANNAKLDSGYIALFPYLIGYISTLGIWFKICGVSIISIITLNYFFLIISSIFLYKLLSKILNNKSKSLILTLLWLLFPLNIYWCVVSVPIIAFNSCLVICVTLTYFLINAINKKNKIILSLILGLMIGIANLYRPIMVLYLVSIIGLYFINILKNHSKNNIINSILILILIMIPYFGFNKVTNKVTISLIDKEISTSLPGYSFYVGSYIPNNGEWSAYISNVLYTKYAEYNYDVNKTQDYMFKEGMTTYYNNGLANIKLLAKKFAILTYNVNEYSYNNFSYYINKNYKVILYISEIIFYIIILLNMYYAYLIIKFKTVNNLAIILEIFTILFFCCSIFLEVSPRYTLPLTFILFILPIILKEVTKMNSKESKETVLNFNVSNYNMKDLTNNIFSDIKNNQKNIIVNVNPLIIMNFYKNKQYIDLFNNEKYQIADGYGIVWASKFRNKIIKERITGIDLMHSICNASQEHGTTIFLCGAKPGVAKKTKEELEKIYPKIKVVGYCDGYVKENIMLKEINKAKPDILFVALGSPKQEEFIFNNQNKFINTKLIMPVGGSFDVISGNLKRAPKFYQKTHTEWLYRMAKEPKRIKQNLSLVKFIYLVIFTNK